MNKKSGRERQKIMFIILIVCFVVALSLTLLFGKPDKEHTSTTNKNTVVSDETTEQVTSDTTLVTGTLGENDTLISATFVKVINEKVIEVNLNNETVQVSLIGIEVSDELKEQEVQLLNETLKPEQQIWLQYDENTINDEGQHLCYVWLSNEVNVYNYLACKQEMLQGILLANDLAQPYEEYPNSRYEASFRIISDN